MGGFLGSMAGVASGVLKAGGGGSKGDFSPDDDGKQRRRLDSYHKGGTVKKSGPANLKKGEVVLTKKQAKKRGKKRSSKR